jgi:glycosyltransferase involved in cell wall biosynthesis
MNSMEKISIVVPVFRNEATLETLYQNVSNVFIGHPKLDLELLFIDDGSDDGSFEIIKKLSEIDSRVRYLSFDKNYGQVAAIIAGLRFCNGDAAIVMSADLQEPPEMILEMIRTWEGGSVITICHRKSREDRFIDKFFSAIFYGTMKLIYPLIPKGGFDFFLLDRSALLVFNSIDKGGRFIQGDVVKLKLPIVFLPYERMSRKVGKSQWTFKRKLLYAFDAITYSRSVLSTITTTGSVLLFCGIALMVREFKPSYLFLLIILSGFILSVFGFFGKVYRSINDQMKPEELYTIDSKSIR